MAIEAIPQEKEEVPHIPYAPINKPLWQRARKDFIKLVDDDKIPEEHKRLNLHYLRTLPYEAISTVPPIIVEAPEPEPEPEPDVMLFPAGQTFSRWVYNGRGGQYQVHNQISKPLYRSDAEKLFGKGLSDEELQSRFITWIFGNNW